MSSIPGATPCFPARDASRSAYAQQAPKTASASTPTAPAPASLDSALDTFADMLLCDTAVEGPVPWNAGKHTIDSLGLERFMWGLRSICVEVPPNTTLIVRSGAIDTQPVTSRRAPRVAPTFSTLVMQLVAWCFFAAWVRVAKVIGRPPLKKNDGDLSTSVTDPSDVKSKGPLRVHGLDATYTHPLIVAPTHMPRWLAYTAITGFHIDEHGDVTPQGEMRLLNRFSVSIERFGAALPAYNMEIEKLRRGELVAPTHPKVPTFETAAVASVLARLTGPSQLTVQRGANARASQHTLRFPAGVRARVGAVNCCITPGKTTAEMSFTGHQQMHGTTRNTTHVQLDSPQLGRERLRVKSQTKTALPTNGENWAQACTTFVVDRHTSADPAAAAAWQRIVGGSFAVNQNNDIIEASATLGVAPGVLPAQLGSPPYATAKGHAYKRADDTFAFLGAEADVPAPPWLEEVEFSFAVNNVRVRGTQNDDNERVRVLVEPRVVELDKSF